MKRDANDIIKKNNLIYYHVHIKFKAFRIIYYFEKKEGKKEKKIFFLFF